MIDHKHKFIFIHIPKCAGISVGRTLCKLIGKDSHNYEGFKIHHDEFDEKIWNEYFVFPLFEIHLIGYILNIDIEIFYINMILSMP